MSLDVPGIMQRLASLRQKNFIYQGQVLPFEQVFAFNGGLSMLVRRANMLSDFLFGTQLNVSLVPDPNALTGERVSINPQQNSFVLIMLLYDVMEEMVVNAGTADIQLS